MVIVWTSEGKSSSILVSSGEVGAAEQRGLNGWASGFPHPLPLPLCLLDIRRLAGTTVLIEVIK